MPGGGGGSGTHALPQVEAETTCPGRRSVGTALSTDLVLVVVLVQVELRLMVGCWVLGGAEGTGLLAVSPLEPVAGIVFFFSFLAVRVEVELRIAVFGAICADSDSFFPVLEFRGTTFELVGQRLPFALTRL